MPDNLDARQSRPSAFALDPETSAASQIIIFASSGIDAGNQSRLDEKSKKQWQGVAARIEGVGPDHGKAILKLLNPIALREGISVVAVTAAIEIYCRDYGLPVPEIPDVAKTMFEEVFSRSL